MACRLQGQVILNTRPLHQQGELTRMLQDDGARVLSFPVIDIEPLQDAQRRQQLARSIGGYDILLFVSRNAVDAAFAFIDSAQLSPDTVFGVIGSATRSALADSLAGSRFDIEIIGDRCKATVLAEPTFDPKNEALRG